MNREGQRETCAASDRLTTAARRYKLTARELEIFRQLATGEPWKSVAASLGISFWTVRFHVRNAHRKIGAANSICAFCKLVGL